MKRKALKSKLRCRMKMMTCSSQVAFYEIRFEVEEKGPFIIAYIKHNSLQGKVDMPLTKTHSGPPLVLCKTVVGTKCVTRKDVIQKE